MNVHFNSLRRAPRQRGLAIVEFTICLPLLLLVLVTTAEFGRAFMHYTTLTKAIRDGVRFAAAEAILGTTGIVVLDDQIIAEARNLVVYGNTVSGVEPVLPGLAPEDITIAPGGPGEIVVRAAYAYDPIYFNLPMFGLGPDINPAYTLRAGVTMRAL